MTHPLDELAWAPLAGLVARAGTAVARRHRRAVAEHGLSTTALGVLAALAGEPAAPGATVDSGLDSGLNGSATAHDTLVREGVAGPGSRRRGAGAPPAGGAGLSHRELAARLGVAPATLTPALDALEDAGDVRRARDPDDRRVVRLAITADGSRRLARAYPLVRAATGVRLPQLPPDDEAVVRRYLLALLAAVAEDGEDGCAR
ncbi:MarR family transcriptional regulator [Pseudonocardia sp.]|uniref:MarR family transcriptional regulator n=1 Tax=Pseudonocardia sp. TaxID=60912 RepID=UPI003D12AE0E